MIKGTTVSIRPLREADLEVVHASLVDIESRGPWYPMPRHSLVRLRAEFQETGFWSPDEGMFVIVDADDRILGEVGWEKLNGSVPDVELAYRVYDAANRGRGIATEAVDLLVGYLFDAYTMNRLLLYIHVDNLPSHRVAEKCGFTKEATAREAWNHKGIWHDLDIYTITRSEAAVHRARS